MTDVDRVAAGAREGTALFSEDAGMLARPEVDRDALNRCRIETRTLQTAQEAYFAQYGHYAATIDDLVAARFLTDGPFLHRIETAAPVAPAQSPYAVVVADPMCGTPGNRAGQTPTDF